MTQVVTIHSFRRGTGKTQLVANLAACLALGGQRVGMVDTNLYAPSLHVPYGLDVEFQRFVLNDYLWDRCSIVQAAYDVSPRLGASSAGQIFLVPSSSKVTEIARIIKEPFDLDRISEGLNILMRSFSLDVLILDTTDGIKEESLVPMAMTDVLAVILRMDQQDYQGTAVTVDVAQNLNVPKICLIANMVPPAFDPEDVRREVEETYGYPVSAVFPYADEIVTLGIDELFVVKYPDHPVSSGIRHLAKKLAG